MLRRRRLRLPAGLLQRRVRRHLLVDNSGTITADASAYYGGASATGVYAVTLYGDLNVDSSGNITATAASGDYSAYSIADATGISAINFSADLYFGDVNVVNSGVIDATATPASTRTSRARSRLASPPRAARASVTCATTAAHQRHRHRRLRCRC